MVHWPAACHNQRCCCALACNIPHLCRPALCPLQEFSPDYDVRLAVTSWAKAHFEVLHTTAYPLDPGRARGAAAIVGLLAMICSSSAVQSSLNVWRDLT